MIENDRHMVGFWRGVWFITPNFMTICLLKQPPDAEKLKPGKSMGETSSCKLLKHVWGRSPQQM
jgi:hypothetical protein